MPSWSLRLFVVFDLLTSLVLGEVVKYTSVTLSPDKFVQRKSFDNAGTLTACAALDHKNNGKAFRYTVPDKTCTLGYVDFGAQASDEEEDPIKVYSVDLSTNYAGMMLWEGNTVIILPNGRVCPQTAFPTTTSDKVSNILAPLAYYKGFVYTCGGSFETTAFHHLDLNNLDLGWQPLAPTPGAIFFAGLIPYDDKIFLWGGRWSFFAKECQTDIYAYDITTNSWSTATTFSDGLAGLESNEHIIHGKYAFLFGYTCAQGSQHKLAVHLYNLDVPGDPPVEMTERLPIEILQSTDCVKVTLSVKGLGILCAGKYTSNLAMDAKEMKPVIFMPLNDDPDVNGWEPWEEMSPLKVGRSSVHLLNLGKQLILAGGFIAYTGWGDMSTFFWNNETLEFQDDQEIEPLPFVMIHASSVTIPLDFVQEMCHDYL